MGKLAWLACVATMGAVVAQSAGAQAQPVYKWVDADGKTHYGSQPPPARQDAEPLKLQSNNGTSGGSGSSSGKGASAKAGQQYNPDGTKKVSKDVEAFGEGLKKSLGTVDSKQVPLNCAVAVDNIHYQADLMLEVGQKNVRDGYMTRRLLMPQRPRSAKPRASTACPTARGHRATRSRFTSACPAARTT